jgi:hypothetical protein
MQVVFQQKCSFNLSLLKNSLVSFLIFFSDFSTSERGTLYAFGTGQAAAGLHLLGFLHLKRLERLGFVEGRGLGVNTVGLVLYL